ncbi:MAG: hypothetical protein ACP5D3_00910, partial [Sulfurovum sp.]
ILETLIDEFSQFPLDIRAFRSSIYKISEENLSVELSKQQLEVIEQKLSHKVSSVTLTLGMMLAAIFLVTYERSYEDLALILFGAGVVRLLFIKK